MGASLESVKMTGTCSMRLLDEKSDRHPDEDLLLWCDTCLALTPIGSDQIFGFYVDFQNKVIGRGRKVCLVRQRGVCHPSSGAAKPGDVAASHHHGRRQTTNLWPHRPAGSARVACMSREYGRFHRQQNSAHVWGRQILVFWMVNYRDKCSGGSKT